MDTLLVFIPNSLQFEDPGYLYGLFDESTPTACAAFYVLGMNRDAPAFRRYSSSGRIPFARLSDYWILVDFENGELVVRKVLIAGLEYDLDKCHIIRYDREALSGSELLYQQGELSSEGDYFKNLTRYVKEEDSLALDAERRPKFFYTFLTSCFALIVFCLGKAYYFSRFTTIGLHLKERAKNILWLVQTFPKRKQAMQTGNYIISLIFDMMAGLLMQHYLAELHKQTDVLEYLRFSAEEILEFINGIIKWLMGSPGGLKLNYPMNYVLGTFFIYNIYLWWTFLGLVRPILEIGFVIFLKIGFLGLSFQIAIMADIFSLVSFHLYCIYIYAARLFELQLRGIISLSRIFLGRKKNPEPGKVDSCPYTTEQMFLGTICFAVLLFLLPTTLVYYIVFTLIRVVAIIIGGVLTRTRYLIEILPLYTTIIWFLKPNLVATNIKLIAIRGLSNSGHTTLKTEMVYSSWLETVSLCTPEVISKPMPVNWKEIGGNIVSGKLIYPI